LSSRNARISEQSAGGSRDRCAFVFDVSRHDVFTIPDT